MDQLIKKCKKFDRKAQRLMVNHLSPMLYSICMRYSKDQEHTKDLVQETLIKVFNNIEKCHATEEAHFRGWCKRIAINTCLSKIRSAKPLSENLEIVANYSNEQHSVLDHLSAEDILKLLDKIPERHKTVFNMFVIDGYNHREIAEVLNIKESSSRTLLLRARQALQGLINLDENSLSLAK